MLEYRSDGPARLMTFDDDMNETRTFLWRIERRVHGLRRQVEGSGCVKGVSREVVAAKGTHRADAIQADQLRPPGYLRLRNQWC